MKLIELADYPFNRVEINWHGPFPWRKDMTSFRVDDRELMSCRGIYRAESSGQNRSLIKYIGSTSNTFGARLSADHRIKIELVNSQFRNVRMFLGVLRPERSLILKKAHFVEIEYILQNIHWQDLISWHGLEKLPKTSRGEGWRISNTGSRGSLHRVIAYPAFAVSGRDS